jgi:hypothetical protein
VKKYKLELEGQIKLLAEEINDKSDKAATKTNYIEMKIYVEVAQKKR